MSEPFVPFGTQYYRAPTPTPDQWDGDLAGMARAGFNTIKIWAQWRWNQPEEDRFDFADIDRLMDLSSKHGLKVVINAIFDVAPVWFWERYPDASMLTNGGRRIGPSVTACRQIGGAPGPCLHHPAAGPAIDAFLAAAVRRYAEHPALLAWDLWNEPELTCDLARDGTLESLVCYCPHSIQAFHKWLEKKYGGLPVLNERWGRNYRSWDEIETPRSPGAIGDMLDWRLFFVETLTAEMARRASVARAFDRSHPVMCHTVPPPVFDPVSCGSDDWQLARACDWFGNSTAGNPFTTDVVVAAAGGRRVINAEIHALPGGTMHPSRPVGRREMEKLILGPLARGVSGFIFWQYRPELLGLEAPAWGLTREDGSPTPWLEDAADLNRLLQANAGLVAGGSPLPAEVGILLHPNSQILTWCATHGLSLYHESLQGAYGMFYRANHRVRLLHPLDLLEGIPESIRIIYLPCPYALDAGSADLLRAWTDGGGTLAAEANFGRYCVETNRHAEIVPGYGFTDVFGAREGNIVPRTGEPVMLIPEPGAGPGWRLEGAELATPLELAGAEPLARFAEGGVAMAKNGYGKGTAVLIGTYLGLASFRTGGGDSPAAALAKIAGLGPAVRADGPVHADVLLAGEECLLIVENRAQEPARGTVHVSLPECWLAEPMLGQAEPVSPGGEGLAVEFNLSPGEIAMARGKKVRPSETEKGEA